MTCDSRFYVGDNLAVYYKMFFFMYVFSFICECPLLISN